MYVCEQYRYDITFNITNNEGVVVTHSVTFSPGQTIEHDGAEIVFEGVDTMKGEQYVRYRNSELAKYGLINLYGFCSKYTDIPDGYDIWGDISCTRRTELVLTEGKNVFKAKDICLVTDHISDLIEEPMAIQSITSIAEGDYDVIFDWLIYDRVPVTYTSIEALSPYLYLGKICE